MLQAGQTTMMEMRNHLSNLTVVENECALETPVRTNGEVKIRSMCRIGRFTLINERTTLFENCRIGRYSSIGKNCEIGVFTPPTDWVSTSLARYDISDFQSYAEAFHKEHLSQRGGAQIGNDVCINDSVAILCGVIVGDGAVVAAGSIVSNHVPPYAIVSGTPAGIIGYRFSKPVIERFLNVQWWDLPLDQLDNINFSNVPAALARFEALRGNEGFPKHENIEAEEAMENSAASRLEAARAAMLRANQPRAIAQETSDFLDMLSVKLQARNIPDSVADYLRKRHSSLFTNYDPSDPRDIEILNNKVQHLAALFGDRPAEAPQLTPQDYTKALRLFQSRH